MKSKRIVWIDLLKAVGFFLVIFGHLEVNKLLDTWIYAFHMPLFLLATGLTYNIEKSYKTSFKDYAFVRFKRLIIPYFWMQMISLTMLYMRRLILGGDIPDLSEYIVGILLSNTQINKYSPAPALYYVVLLFLAEIGLWFIIRFSKGDKKTMFFVLFLLLPLSLLNKKKAGVFHINVVPVAMMIIFIGRLLMDAYNNGLKKKLEELSPVIYSALCAGMLVVGSVLAYFNERASLHANKYGKDFTVYILCALLMNIGLALILMKASEMLPSKILGIFVYVGQSTLFYLGIHSQFRDISEQIGRKITDIQSWPFLIITTLVLYFLLIPLSKLTDKHFPFIVGKSTVKPDRKQKLCQTFMVFFAFANVFYVSVFHLSQAVMPAFIATLAGKIVIYSIATVIWVGLSLGISEAVRRFVPLAFLIEKPQSKKVSKS